jgi:hypothetical protein
VNGDVETHAFPEMGVFKAKLVCVVSAVVEGSISGRYPFIISVLVVIDNRSDSRNFGADVKCVLVG